MGYSSNKRGQIVSWEVFARKLCDYIYKVIQHVFERTVQNMYTLQSSTAVKHEWNYTATPPSVPIVACYGAITLPLRMIGV